MSPFKAFMVGVGTVAVALGLGFGGGMMIAERLDTQTAVPDRPRAARVKAPETTGAALTETERTAGTKPVAPKPVTTIRVDPFTPRPLSPEPQTFTSATATSGVASPGTAPVTSPPLPEPRPDADAHRGKAPEVVREIAPAAAPREEAAPSQRAVREKEDVKREEVAREDATARRKAKQSERVERKGARKETRKQAERVPADEAAPRRENARTATSDPKFKNEAYARTTRRDAPARVTREVIDEEIDLPLRENVTEYRAPSPAPPFFGLFGR